MLRQHASGERAGARGSDEICRDFVSVLHVTVSLHALPGESGPVSVALPSIFFYDVVIY